MADRDVIVHILGDSRSYEQALRRSETKTAAFGKRLDAIGAGTAVGGRGGLASSAALLRGGGIALGAGIAAQQIRQLTDAASDLNEQITKSQQVFGKSADEVQAWSKTTATSIGISQTAALEAAGTFGNLFSTVGLGQEQAAQMSRRLVQLAADLASFNNADPRDTLDALRSGLIGEAEPLRRFGVLLSEARVQQRAMADTGKTTAKSLTDQEKAIARYEIILRDTGKAQGDFARTSDGLANQQRKLNAQFADLRVSLGKIALPLITQLVTVMNDGIGAANVLGDALGKLGVKGSDVGKAIGAAFAATPGLGIVIGEVKLLNSLFGDTEKKIGDVQAAADAFANSFGLKALQDAGKAATQPAKPPPSFGEPGFKPGRPNEVFRPGISPEQRNRIFDAGIARELDRASDLGIRAQIAALTRIQAELQRRIDITKDITRKLNLEDQIVAIGRQKRSLAQELLDNAAEAKRRAKALADQAEATRLAQRQSRQLRALGFAADGGDLVPGAANLRKQLEQLGDRLDSSGAKISSKLRSQLRAAGRVLRGEFGPITREARARINQLAETVRSELEKAAKPGGPLTPTTAINAGAILRGLGVGPETERELRARLSHFNSAGVALAGAGASTVVVNSTLVVDGHVLAKNTSKHQTKTRKRNPPPRRGPNAGLIIG